MKKDAEAHADEDKKKQEMIETKNLADQVVYMAEKTLKDNEAKIPADMKKQAEEKLSALKEAQKNDNIDDIKAKTKELSEVMSSIARSRPQEGQKMANDQGSEKPEEKLKDEPRAEEGEFKEK
jgi:molecular chaperone DnaK